MPKSPTYRCKEIINICNNEKFDDNFKSKLQRKTIIKICVGLNQSTQTLNDILISYGQKPLGNEDVMTLIEICSRRDIDAIAGFEIVYSGLNTDLILLSFETILDQLENSTVKTVHTKLSYLLKSEEQVRKSINEKYLSLNDNNYGLRVFNAELETQIFYKRKEVLHSALNKEKHNNIEVYVCSHCLDKYFNQYFEKTNDDIERYYIKEHFINLINMLEKYPNYQFRTLSVCPTFIYELIDCEPNPLIFFMAQHPTQISGINCPEKNNLIFHEDIRGFIFKDPRFLSWVKNHQEVILNKVIDKPYNKSNTGMIEHIQTSYIDKMR